MNLNDCGWMSTVVDRFTQLWVDRLSIVINTSKYSQSSSCMVIEIDMETVPYHYLNSFGH